MGCCTSIFIYLFDPAELDENVCSVSFIKLSENREVPENKKKPPESFNVLLVQNAARASPLRRGVKKRWSDGQLKRETNGELAVERFIVKLHSGGGEEVAVRVQNVERIHHHGFQVVPAYV